MAKEGAARWPDCPTVATSSDFNGNIEVSWKKRSVLELGRIEVPWKKRSVYQSCKGLLESSKETHLWSTTREGKTSEKIKDVGVVLVSIPYLFNQNLHSNSNCTTQQPPALCSLRSLCSHFFSAHIILTSERKLQKCCNFSFNFFHFFMHFSYHWILNFKHFLF